jgi:hypothetical protein
LSGEPATVALCHCTHCQRQSGSVFSTNLVLAEADYAQTGETAMFQDTGGSGQPVYRYFCGTCGSPIVTRIPSMPGVVLLKAGTLDDLTGLQPVVEVFADHAAEWVAPVSGASRFGQTP